MRRFLSVATAAAAIAAVPAFAVPTITSISVTGGDTGFTWNTAVDSNYTLFVQHPVGTRLNPNDDFTSAHVFSNQPSNYQMIGDGFPLDSRASNSDPFYTLMVVLTENGMSQTLSATVTGPVAQTFAAINGTALFSGVNYTLTDFNWVRGNSNLVGQFSDTGNNHTGVPVGALSDYQGAFTLSAAGVPEPSTWAMMIFGFGAVAGTMRYRRRAALATA